MGLKEKIPDKVIDVKGKICPYPAMETRDALKQLQDGEVLEIITDHPPAAMENIPRICEKKGYVYEIIEEEGEIFKVLIEKREN